MADLKALHEATFPIAYEAEFYSNVVHHRGIISWGAVDPCKPDRLVGFITARLVPPAEAQAADVLPLTPPSPCHTPSPSLLYILTLGVAKPYRKAGVASHLVHLLLSHASSLPHCAAVYLHVVAYNAAAIRFYRSLRFCYRRRLSRFYYLEGGDYDALLFARYVNGWLPPDSRSQLQGPTLQLLQPALTAASTAVSAAMSLVCVRPTASLLRAFMHSGWISIPAVALLLVALLAPATRAMPVSDLISALKSKDVQYDLMERLFALDGTKDISGVTILVPRSDEIPNAYSYARHDNTTRKYNQAIADALTILNEADSSAERWTAVSQNFSAAAKGALSDIWKFQIVKQYIPPSVATQKYSSGGPWELPTMEGQPLWMAYYPMYGGEWNISGSPPQQQASAPLPRVNGNVQIDGSPFAYTVEDAGDVVQDFPDSQVVVYKSHALLLPYNMEALSAYAGANASIFHLLASIGLALTALLLL
ncbi:unnamed protein product [Closterium sp. Yama58-4]|nr:unnamed protein product [Closterium sp. Yama58-4]